MRPLLRKGYSVRSQKGLHVVLTHPERGNYVWALRDGEEIGPRMLARIAKHTGLTPEDLYATPACEALLAGNARYPLILQASKWPVLLCGKEAFWGEEAP